MSPELLGWHEQHGIDPEHGLVGASEPLSLEPGSEEQPPSFHFTRLPASAIKGKPMADGSILGKAVRVKTPAKYAVAVLLSMITIIIILRCPAHVGLMFVTDDR